MRNNERQRTNIEEALNNEGGKYDAIMFPGDLVVIPRFPNTVAVTGEVNNPGKYSFVEGKSLNFYIDLAGGRTDSADFALISFPEGFVEKSSKSWLFGSNPDIPDGSSIRLAKIPPKPPEIAEKEGRTFYDFFKDSLAIVVSAVTVIVLASKL
jgi:protein involved in polysaccharide export with SLBB domain